MKNGNALLSKRALLVVLILAMITATAVIWGPRACHFLWYGPEPHSLTSDLLNIDHGFDFPPGFPPDPGEAGRKTLQGVDLDGDGIRDDVQRWIHALYPDAPEKRLAFRQWARYFQFSLRSEFGPETRRESLKMLDRAIDCRTQVFEDLFQSHYETQHLKAKVLNTYDRTARYLDNGRRTTTQEMAEERSRDEQPCDHR